MAATVIATLVAFVTGYLFDNTGDDPVNTLGSYYQGLGAVQTDGLYPETQQYVNSVLTLRDYFANG